MATRKKSIKVPVNFGNPADLVNNTTTTIGTPTVFIAENSVGSPVTFSSVMLFVAAQDTSTATGATVTTFTTTLTLSGAAASAVTISAGTLANSGENWGGLFGPIDYTTYFNTNYGTVTSKALTVQVLSNITTGTGVTTRGVYGYLEITYTYNDAAATRIKTVCVPYESTTTSLPTVSTLFATLPQLTGAGGWLNGYAGLTIRHRWLEIKGNCNNNNTTTDFNLNYSFDGGITIVLPTRESGLASDTYQIYQIDITVLGTAATRAFALWSSLASRFFNVVVNEWITFEYTVSGTTQALNYIEIPVEFDSPVPGATSAVALRLKRPLTIQEPATLIMRKCSVELNYNTNASTTVDIRGGIQSYRSYAQSSNVVAGQFSFQHGLDASSAQGAAFTLVRGENQIVIDLFRSVNTAYNVTGILKMLYASGIDPDGIDNHSDTRRGLVRQMSFTTVADDTVANESFAIPETNYWLQGLALQNYFWLQATTNTVTQQASVLSTEGEGAGWRDLFTDQYLGDNELSYGTWTVRARPEYKRYPQEPDNSKLNITGSRSYRTTSTTAIRFGTAWTVAYHTMTSSLGGTISDSSGGTVQLYAFRADTEEVYITGSRVGNGTYNFPVYDDTLSYYVVAYESATLKGVSKIATPATNFDISLTGAGGGGGEFFF